LKGFLQKLYGYGGIESKEIHLWINHVKDIGTVRYVKALSFFGKKILNYV